MTPQEQRHTDQAEIKVKLIENGVLVRCGDGWFSFDTWEKASAHIAERLKALEKKRQQAQEAANAF